MKILRRLYRHLAHYKVWAVIAFSSMLIFAATQTAMMALVRPLFDVVLSSPAQKREPTHVSREQATRDKVLDVVLQRDRPEARQAWLARNLNGGIARATGWWK